MAEGLLREDGGDRFESLSAGSKPAGYVHPRAVAVMSELGIDISAQESKSIQRFLPPDGSAPDVIISVCSNAENDCPIFPGSVVRWHWPFEDPAFAAGNEDQKLQVFREVRDQIRTALRERLLQNEDALREIEQARAVS